MKKTNAVYLRFPFNPENVDETPIGQNYNLTWQTEIGGTKRSKWDILVERRAILTKALEDVTYDINWMETTSFPQNPWDGDKAGCCSKCGHFFRTEADFAKHYLVSDETLSNLGYCPKTGKEKDIQAIQDLLNEHPEWNK